MEVTVRSGKVLFLLVLAAGVLIGCPRHEGLRPEDYPQAPPPPLLLDEEDFGLRVRVGDNMSKPPRSPYRFRKSQQVAELMVKPDAPVVSYLCGDLLAVSYAYDKRLRCITAIVVTAWPGEDAEKLRKAEPEEFLARQASSASRAHDRFPEVASAKGIGVGSSRDDVLAAYGQPQRTTAAGSLVYGEGNFELVFGCGSGTVLMMALALASVPGAESTGAAKPRRVPRGEEEAPEPPLERIPGLDADRILIEVLR